MVLLLKGGKPAFLLGPVLGSVSKKISIKRLVFLFILAAVLFVLVINAYVFSYGQKFILEDGFDAPLSTTPTAIILGASVYPDGSLSPVLEQRAETALGLYQNGLVKKIIVSGDNRESSYNEVMPIRAFLLENHVPAEDIFADFAGFSTYDSVYRAREIFGAKDVLIVTQGFHLPRSIYAARHLGLNAYGVAAGGDKFNLKNSVRELFATVKTFFSVLFKVEPYFLGRDIPIEGDGRNSLE